jgi:glutamine amidotransferase
LKTVAIIDYDMGNLDSVASAVEVCGGTPVVTRQAKDFEVATHIILPGVGSFPEGMNKIRTYSLLEILNEQVMGNKIPFLGICLGMQLLATKGFEGDETEGFGWIDGEVLRLEPPTPDFRIPHIGWNEVSFTAPGPLFKDVPSGKDFYFVHSYHLVCRNSRDVLATTPYCGNFISAVGRDNIYGVQFHPEKSQRLGLQVIKNFLEL